MRHHHYFAGLALLTVLALGGGCATTPSPLPGGVRRFDYAQDTLAYANDTVWTHAGAPRPARSSPADGQTAERYSRHCFVMAAAVVQFWKFARFDPEAPPVSEQELARRVRQIRDTATWDPVRPAGQRVVIPGYRSLRDLSARDGKLLRANLGAGWTTYFHVRKYAMPFVPGRAHQARTQAQLQEWLARGQPMVLWLYNFPHVNMNHAVTVYAEAPAAAPGQLAYWVYDPNATDGPRQLSYDPSTRTFSYPKTFYFEGGTVHVRPVYLSLFH